MLGAQALVVVKQDLSSAPATPITVKVSKNVRQGVIDGKKKPSKFMITLNNVEYAFGEDILMQVDCDNTESSVGVKAIKFKLYLCYQQRQEDSSLT
jgi:hypothetical protein